MTESSIRLHRPESTCRKWWNKYSIKHSFGEKKGGKTKKAPDKIDAIISKTQEGRRSTIRGIQEITTLSRELVRQIRHENHYHFYDQIPVPPLDDPAKLKRIAFCKSVLNHNLNIPIVFTDESMIIQDLKQGGIWRLRTESIPDEF
jgi:hypothetical protein